MTRFYDDLTADRLIHPSRTADGSPECLPRRSAYGSETAAACGLVPMLDYPDMLVQPADFKAVIEECRLREIFAMYHQKASGVFDAGWNQGPYGYCWAYGLTAAVMDCRAVEGQKPVRLSPFSLGWLVDWRNTGWYPDSAIKGARERGIAPLEYVPERSLNYRGYKAGWEEEARKYRPTEWWDTKRSEGVESMVAQCLSILRTGRSLYVAYLWWRHALQCVGMRFDERQPNNVVWILRNSHNEADLIELAGSRGVPDEAYGVRSTSLTE